MISFEYKEKYPKKFPLLRRSMENKIVVLFINKIDGIALMHPNQKYVGIQMQGWADIDGVYWDKDRNIDLYTS